MRLQCFVAKDRLTDSNFDSKYYIAFFQNTFKTLLAQTMQTDRLRERGGKKVIRKMHNKREVGREREIPKDA